MGGTRVNVTNAPAGQTLPSGSAEPQFGLETYNLEGDMARLQTKGAEVLQQITEVPGGVKIAFIKSPDNVRLELLQPAR